MIIGVLGCMAERLKSQILERETTVDIVAGPDAYRDLPNLIQLAESNYDAEEKQTAINVQLSFDETYADIRPVWRDKNKVSSWVSIMWGCNNMCAFCIVPFTRGRERSWTISSIEDEVRILQDQGYKEVTLLGQNVNSYLDREGMGSEHENSEGFAEMYKLRGGEGSRFADLLERVSTIAPEMRFWFTSPHPKDFPDAVLDIISERSNICS